jgi:hypothetical protein
MDGGAVDEGKHPGINFNTQLNTRYVSSVRHYRLVGFKDMGINLGPDER